MGKVLMSGIVPKLSAPVPPVEGIYGGDLAVGNSVFLKVNGVLKEFLIVNKGIPGKSSLYDSSCDGLWLLMKDIYENRQWHSSNIQNYSASTIHTYLNGTFLNLFDADVQAAIKQVKIPYSIGTGYMGGTIGSSGLSTKIFLLSCYELGFTSSGVNSDTVDIDEDGAVLSYFTSGTSAAANNKRVAYLDGSATTWWTRTPNGLINGKTMSVQSYGGTSSTSCTYERGVRPALILPSNALFNPETMEFVGVA